MILIVDEVEQTVPLLIVHFKIVVPVPMLVKLVVAKLGDVILAVPDTIVQRPEPTVGVFAPKAVVAEQIVWFGPALAIGNEIVVIVTLTLMFGVTELQ